jgi:hypothetical protein
MRTCAIMLNGIFSACFGTLVGAQTFIPESSARDLKGLNSTNGAVAVVTPQGSIDSVAGQPSVCVLVNGSSGPCTYFINGEQPSGTINGINPTFTLSGIPYPPSSLQLFRNGILQQQSGDYTLASGRVTFMSASIPQPGDILLTYYQIAPPITSSSKATRAHSQTSSRIDYEIFDRHLRAAVEQAQALSADFPLIEFSPKKGEVSAASVLLLQRRLGTPLQRALIIDTQPEPMRAPLAGTRPPESRGIRLLQNKLSAPLEQRLRADRSRPTHDLPKDMIFVSVSVEPTVTSGARLLHTGRLNVARPEQPPMDIEGPEADFPAEPRNQPLERFRLAPSSRGAGER